MQRAADARRAVRVPTRYQGQAVYAPHIGYLHSGFEKLGEYRQYNQIIPLTDRTDYLAPMANNIALAMAVEAKDVLTKAGKTVSRPLVK